MSNHPMCLGCIAKSVCSAKYGQPCCVDVHSLTMEFGRTVANSEEEESQLQQPTKHYAAALEVWPEYDQWVDERSAEEKPICSFGDWCTQRLNATEKT